MKENAYTRLLKILVERFFELLIKYYKGDMSRMKLAEELGLSFSKTKIYVEQIEKTIIDEYKEFEEKDVETI